MPGKPRATGGSQGAEPPFRPFADEAAVCSLGAFSIENGTERIALHGTLDLTRDREGLARAERLKGVLDGIVRTLRAQARADGLPERVAEDAQAPRSVRNPFA